MKLFEGSISKVILKLEEEGILFIDGCILGIRTTNWLNGFLIFSLEVP
jgi:hypothetical protein